LLWNTGVHGRPVSLPKENLFEIVLVSKETNKLSFALRIDIPRGN